MARFNINDYNKNEYIEISFKDGLNYIEEHKDSKLYSDGLEFDEYIIFVDDHFEYEDGCFLGRTEEEIIFRTNSFNSWILNHKFYIFKKIKNENN